MLEQGLGCGTEAGGHGRADLRDFTGAAKPGEFWSVARATLAA